MDVLPPFAIAATFLLSIPAMAAHPQDPGAVAPKAPAPACDPAVEALLGKVETARGRAPLPATMRIRGDYTVHFEGAGDEPVAKGTFTELFAGGNSARHESDMGPMGRMQRGITEDLAWEIDPAMGAKVRRGEQELAVRRYFAILRGETPRALYGAITKQSSEQLDGALVTVLACRPAEGRTDEWRIDADGRVRRIDIVLPAPESADASWNLDDGMAAQITFGDWREVAGRSVPHVRKLQMGPATVTFTCNEIQTGVEFGDDAFAPPKAIAELRPDAMAPAFDEAGKPNYQIVDRKAQPVASIRVKCKPDQISATLATILPEVMERIDELGARMAGAPFSRYHGFGPDGIDLEAGIPVQQPIAEKGRVKNGELPKGPAVTVWHVGPYHELGKAHEGLSAWAKANGKKARGGPWEIYWTDPGMVTDPKKWKTQLFLPIE